jgi:glycosyltransferase involved in cell wall biosynthesis
LDKLPRPHLCREIYIVRRNKFSRSFWRRDLEQMQSVSHNKKLRIITINHHEAFLSALAKTGHDFYVITRYKDHDLAWNPSSHPVPENFNLIEFNDEQKAKLKSGYYDILICHTVKNLLFFFPYCKVPCIFIAHITLKNVTFVDSIRSLLKKIVYQLFSLTHKTKFVGVSELKYKSWSIQGEIIPTFPFALPPPESGIGYDRVIVVGNHMKRRGLECGYDLIEQVMQKIPLTIIGNNPDIVSAVIPKNRREFIENFRSGRIFLFTTRFPHNDGYNLAMLEAMLMGMAIVTVDNPSSPIIHNYNGFIGNNAEEIIVHLRRLLENPQLIDELGRNAQKTVNEQFSEELFVKRWNQLLYRTANVI